MLTTEQVWHKFHTHTNAIGNLILHLREMPANGFFQPLQIMPITDSDNRSLTMTL